MSTPPPRRASSPVPNLEQQKKLAKELLAALKAADPGALVRWRAVHPRAFDPATARLADAQLVLAREAGFPSWPRFKAHIEQEAEARRSRPFVRELSYYDERACGLLEILPDGEPGAIAQVRDWHPEYGGLSDEVIRKAPLTLEDTRLVYARQHGFATWDRLAAHLAAVQAGAEPDPFMAVFEAGRALDWPRVVSLLRAHPDLARARGTNGNTLLNLASSLTPRPDASTDVLARLPGGDRLGAVRLLLRAGADPNQANDRGWSPLHQAAYCNDPEQVTLLLEAAARPDLEGHGAGGTPLAVALFWGHREAADRLAPAGVVPANLRIAAGLGDAALMVRLVPARGRVTPEAGSRRGFYRPHSGFPRWQPGDDPQEVLDEALVWAARSGRTEVLDLLVARGADPAADPYRGTALIWAAAKGRTETIARLLDLGADVNQQATFGGPSHGEGVTALHLAAQSGQREAARLLLARGADPTITDRLYASTPAGWARHGGHLELATELERARPG